MAVARQDKKRKCPELAGQAHRIEFVVAACGVGGLRNKESVDLVRARMLHRAASAVPALRASFCSTLVKRYWGILSVAIERDGADNLLYDPPHLELTSPVFPFPRHRPRR